MDSHWLEERIREMAEKDSLGHAVILTGDGDLPAAARFIAMAMECAGAHPPCGQCGPCHKVTEDIHPDVVTVRDPEHKNLSLEVVRWVRSDASVVPNEGRRKIYIFPDCALLEPRAQNVLLKVLEDGPPRAAFLLCAPNLGQLLPTIRSRCETWQVSGQARSAGEDGRAEELWRLLLRRDRVGVTAFFTGLEQSKVKREELQTLAGLLRRRAVDALAAEALGREDGGACAALGRRRLAEAADLLGLAQSQLRFNLGTGHVCGALAVELSALLEKK